MDLEGIKSPEDLVRYMNEQHGGRIMWGENEDDPYIPMMQEALDAGLIHRTNGSAWGIDVGIEVTPRLIIWLRGLFRPWQMLRATRR